jgi:WD40 repeat protein
MRLKTYCVLTVLLVALSCKKDDPTQPVVPTTPQVRIVSPENNGLVAGVVTVLIEATDDKGVARVEAYVDSQLDTTLSVPPYRYLWDTRSYPDSSRHTIFAKAYDTDNNVTGSEVVTNTVLRFPAPSNLTATSLGSHEVRLSWLDNSTLESQFVLERAVNGGQYATIATLPANEVTYTNTSLDTNETFSYRVKAEARYNSSGYSNTISIRYFLHYENIRTLTGHADGVTSVAFSPNGNTIASGSYDYSIKLWHVNSGTLLRTLIGHTGGVSSVAFSPDGNTIASSGDSIRLWRVSDGTLLRTLTGNVYGVSSVAFSPDGNMIASGSADRTVKLWRISDGTLLRTLTGHSDAVRSVAFSPDGNTIASGSQDESIKLWRVGDGALLRTLTGHTYIVWSVAFCPDGNTIASGDNNSIKLWRVSDGTLLRTLTGQTIVRSVAFSPDGNTIASGSGDNSIKLWRTSDGALLGTLTGHTSTVGSVAFSPDGSTIASGSGDRTAKLWQSTGGIWQIVP